MMDEVRLRVIGQIEENQCRSNDCRDVAEFRVYLPEYIPMGLHPGHWGGKHPMAKQRVPEWEGRFCLPHLLRVLELKMTELHFNQEVTIERIQRA